MRGNLFIQLLLITSSVLAVKEYLFKTCPQSGFCTRNRHFAQQVSTTTNYKSPYSIDPDSIILHDGVIFGVINKHLPQVDNSTVQLLFDITLVEGNFRFRLDENRQILREYPSYLNQLRYNETSDWAFQPGVQLDRSIRYEKLSADKIHLSYRKDYDVIISLNPIKFQFIHQGKEQLVINDKQFLNFEHRRLKSENDLHLSPQEISFDMFQDSFPDSSKDTIPLGPESIAIDFTFSGFSHLYGIPEHSGSMLLKDTTHREPYRLFNVDIFEYEQDSRLPMYGSIPLLIAAKPDAAVGVFWINAADSYVDINLENKDGGAAHFMSENGLLDFIIIIEDNVDEVNRQYGKITGYTQLPALFSLGYHQCRWNYNDEKDVLDIHAKFDKYKIPYDTIWLDIEYTDQKKYFTWNKENFPNPKRMLSKLDTTGRNLVVIIDPHLKVDYEVSRDLISQNLAILDSTNNPYHGHCWPGESIWIDTFNPEAQSYWKSRFGWDQPFLGPHQENIHIWNDMNEPSVFDGPETTSPKDNLHYGGWEHRSLHNLYGLTYHQATYHAMQARLEDRPSRQRPFVLTRSYFAGSQRSAAMWTGDNMSKWEYLKISIPMVLTHNIVGMPFSGADVGGFFGNPSKELLTRWYQTGIFYPFFRAHANIDSRRREPWVSGEPYVSYIREAVRLRYKLLSVFYTSFKRGNEGGRPVMRPLFYEAPGNLEAYGIDDEFFVGDSGILVKPVTDEGVDEVEVYIPDEEVYYDFMNGKITKRKVDNGVGYVKKKVELNDIPMYLKGGSILSVKERYRRSSKLMKYDPYTVIIALNKQGKASGELYIDDGESYKNVQGEYVDVKFSADKNSISTNVKSGSDQYIKSIDSIHVENIQIVGLDDKIKSIEIEQGGETWSGRVETKDGIATIKNPKVKINSNWKISINYKDDMKRDEL
ncbi:ROT2 [[Candida] subhashii]|uniref:ROT2 n=1 Tax=[Candida] subhashii TaxID=561895 RepID=A0A8J5QHZ4_9ASCO|nr:ROT2 [[Candida] subhashii]KAG7664986.1 ROT2 [[Candida] subhashii]